MKSVLLTLILLASAFAASAIDVTFNVVAPTCHGYTNGSLTALPSGGAGGYTYAWSNGQSGQTLLGVGAGTYTVTVTDQLGVTAVAPFELLAPAQLTLSFSQTTPNCDGTFQAVQTTVDGGIGGPGLYTYSWSTGATTESITPTTSGNVFVTVTDLVGCSIADTYYVPVPSQIFNSFFVIAPTCFGGNNGAANVAVVGNYGPHTWTWSTGTHASEHLTGVASGTYGITITDQNGCSKTDSIFVPTQAPLQVTPLVNHPLCYGTASGNIHAIGNGGVAPYSYVWNTGATTQILENVAAGVYTVSITDGNGCTASSQATAIDPSPLTNTVVNVTPACGNNGSITVQPAGGTPPYVLNWNAGQYFGTTNFGLAPGNYYICTMDANHCQLDINVVVPGSLGLNVDLVTEKAECVGVNNGVATAVVSGGSGSYSYTWSNGATSVPQINGLAAGETVSVTVTDLVSGCTGTDQVQIDGHGSLILQVIDSDVSCAGNSTGTATVNALNGVAPYQYNWATGSIAQTVENLLPGAYAVTVTDARGCSAVNVADIGVIADINAAFAITEILCDTELVKLTITDQSTSSVAISTWHWIATWGGNTTEFYGQGPVVVNVPVNTAGTIQLTVTSTDGCTDTHIAPFVVGAPPAITWNVDASAANCDGGPVTIDVTGSPDYVYQWTPTDGLSYVNNNPQHVLVSNPATNTLYQVVANNFGCLDTLGVNVQHVVPFDINLGGAAFVTCDTNQLLTATLSLPQDLVGSISWQNAAGVEIGNGPSITVPATNVVTPYTVIVTTDYGCTETASAVVVSNGVDVNAQILASTSACGTAGVQAGITNLDPTDILMYSWSVTPAGATISDPISPNPVISGPVGTYTVQVVVTNQYNCSETLSAPITFTPSGTLEGQVTADLCNGTVVTFSNTSSQSGTWNFGDNTSSTDLNPTHTYVSAGSYTATFVPDDGCFLPVTLPLAVTAQPAVVAAITSNLDACLGTATFTFSDASTHSAPIGGWSWVFSPGNQTSSAQNPVITFTQEGNITAQLIVTDVNNCSDSSDVITLEVDIVNENILGGTGICAGVETELNPNPNTTYNYNWTAVPVDPNLAVNSPNPTVAPTQPTVYSVSITNGNCTVAQTVAFTIHDGADVNASPDTVVCDRNSVLISASSPNASNFEWSKSKYFNTIFAVGPTASVIATIDGMNYVRATTVNGCPGMDSVMVFLGATDVAPAQVNNYVCNGVSAELGVVNLNSNDQLVYSWDNGLPAIANPSVAPTTTTVYQVTVTNQYACADTLAFNVIPQNLQLNITVTGKTTICPGESTQLGAAVTGGTGYTYVWTPSSSLDNATVANPIATPEETTDYEVTATDIVSGCTITGNTLITMLVPQCADPFIFVPKAFTPNGDDSNDYFRVRGVNMTELYFVVWDRWGEKMYETNEVNHIGWDGIFKGVASTPDSYAWYARVRCADGLVWERKGNVTLLK